MSGKKEVDLYQVSANAKLQVKGALALPVVIVRLDVNRGVGWCMLLVTMTHLAERQMQAQKGYDNQYQYFDSWSGSSAVKMFQLIFHDFDVMVISNNRTTEVLQQCWNNLDQTQEKY